jgi:hypothetical protein
VNNRLRKPQTRTQACKETTIALPSTTLRHSHDACAIVESADKVGLEYFIKPRRTKVWEANPTKTCTEKKGFRHYDLVKSSRGGKTVVGSVRSLKANQIALRTKSDDNYLVSYSKSRLLQRFAGLIYSW